MNIYFSNDGISWLQVNKISATGGDNYTTFTGKTESVRTGQEQATFAIFESAGMDYGEIFIADNSDKDIFSFRMEGTGALNTRTFYGKEVQPNGANTPVKYITSHDHHLIAAGLEGEETRIDLIVFCENSLHKLININDVANIRVDPIAENVGCLSGYSIQEIGGDLVFLAPDGIRTVAGTARIGDVELGTVSKLYSLYLEKFQKTLIPIK